MHAESVLSVCCRNLTSECSIQQTAVGPPGNLPLHMLVYRASLSQGLAASFRVRQPLHSLKSWSRIYPSRSMAIDSAVMQQDGKVRLRIPLCLADSFETQLVGSCHARLCIAWQNYDALCEKLKEISTLNGIAGLLGWDEMVSTC